MTHFLLIYDQVAGKVLLLEAFSERDRSLALEKRFALERAHASDPNLEIIVLSAPTQAALETTHARYFKDIQELASN